MTMYGLHATSRFSRPRGGWLAGATAAAVIVFASLVPASTTAQAPPPGGKAAPEVHVYKTPTCGCCGKWVEHLQKHGFTVRTTNQDDLTSLKAKHGVPEQAQSCHTALVDGYVVEGHVPAADIRRLLQQRPLVVGVAVPGMPAGSPGMEVAGGRTDAYDVLAFDKRGTTRVFVSHR